MATIINISTITFPGIGPSTGPSIGSDVESCKGLGVSLDVGPSGAPGGGPGIRAQTWLRSRPGIHPTGLNWSEIMLVLVWS